MNEAEQKVSAVLRRIDNELEMLNAAQMDRFNATIGYENHRIRENWRKIEVLSARRRLVIGLAVLLQATTTSAEEIIPYQDHEDAYVRAAARAVANAILTRRASRVA